MSVESALLLGLFLGLLLVGAPFWLALGFTSLAVFVYSDISLIVLAQKMVGGTQSFSLLAIPFFVLTGELMSSGGLAARLIEVANVFVRHWRGGLGMVLVLAAAMFSAISGSAVATTATIGALMLPEMVKRGYQLPFSTALAVSAGIIGPMIPPSIAFVLWGVIAQESIAQLFLAGIVPGLMLAAGLMALCWLHAYRNDIPRETRAGLRDIASAIIDARWAILLPFVILGGIYGGVFTPTEAGVVGAVYAFAVTTMVTRSLDLRSVWDAILRSIRTTAIVMFIVSAAAPFGWLVALEQLPNQLAGLLTGVSEHDWMILAWLNAMLLAVGAIADEVSVMIILGPMLVEIGNQLGIDGIHFGAFVVLNFCIGMATPPFGYTMLIGMALSRLDVWTITKSFWPHFLVMVCVLLLTTYVPQVSLFYRYFW